jgi:hypothetical protein
MIVRPGPVVDFLIANQNVRDPFSLDWNKVTKCLEDFFVLFYCSLTVCYAQLFFNYTKI